MKRLLHVPWLWWRRCLPPVLLGLDPQTRRPTLWSVTRSRPLPCPDPPKASPGRSTFTWYPADRQEFDDAPTAVYTSALHGPDLILSGSSTLTSTLLEHGLADEVLLAVYPVLLGTGKRFFAEGTRRAHLSLSARRHFRPASSSLLTRSPDL